MGFGLVGVFMKAALAGQSSGNPRNWPALGRTISLGLGRPQMSNHQKIKKLWLMSSTEDRLRSHKIYARFMNLFQCLSRELWSICAKHDKNQSHLLIFTQNINTKKVWMTLTWDLSSFTHVCFLNITFHIISSYRLQAGKVIGWIFNDWRIWKGLKSSVLSISNCSDSKESACNAEDLVGLIPGSGRSPGESQGQRSLAGYIPWGCKSQTRLSD